ncbi:GntR family transcriptional regulator [Derxia lacustris]|uniref:GntR family transcriptional regulator n=1 Tax=Derxia lacustris TaxID=764842 RepID=UPI00111C2715|nr:GntR family transcriptional regulator [Derxia lacustris]
MSTRPSPRRKTEASLDLARPAPRKRASRAAGAASPAIAASAANAAALADAPDSAVAPNAAQPANDGSAAPAATPRRRVSGIDQRIYEAVLNAVMTHRLPPGTKLTEASFCDLYKVSRTIVRKALLRLAHDHIVELRPNRGAVIASPTPQEKRDVFHARRIVEAAVVPLAIRNASRSQIAKLRQMVRDERAALDRGDRGRWIRLGAEFHLALAEVAGNQVLTNFLSELSSRCSLIIALYDSPTSVPCAHDEHEHLIDAIAAGDIERATAMMEEHLQAIEDRLLPERRGEAIDLAQILGDG